MLLCWKNMRNDICKADLRPFEEYRIIRRHINQKSIAKMRMCDGVVPKPTRQWVINSNSVDIVRRMGKATWIYQSRQCTARWNGEGGGNELSRVLWDILHQDIDTEGGVERAKNRSWKQYVPTSLLCITTNILQIADVVCGVVFLRFLLSFQPVVCLFLLRETS